MFYRALFVCAVTLALTACSGHSQSPVPIVKSGSSLTAAPNASATIYFNAVALPSQFAAYAIMPDGRITGSYGSAAAIYERGQIIILGSYPNASLTVAASINKSSVAVGYAVLPEGTSALEFSNGTMRVLSPPQAPNGMVPFDANEALAINNRAEILGGANQRSSSTFPALATYSSSATGALIQPPGGGAFPYTLGSLANIDDAGEYAFTEIEGHAADPSRRAERGRGLVLLRLFPQYDNSAATWINNGGDITGWVDLTNGGLFTPLTAFVYGRSGVTFLPQLADSIDMTPTGINGLGDVVGATRTGLFFYTHGQTKAIATGISISGLPEPGLSERDEFVIVANDNKEYLLSPNR